MNEELKEARRYHWQSHGLPGFFESPHTAIEGRNVGAIVNLADVRAARSRRAGLELLEDGPDVLGRSVLHVVGARERVSQCPATAGEPAEIETSERHGQSMLPDPEAPPTRDDSAGLGIGDGDGVPPVPGDAMILGWLPAPQNCPHSPPRSTS